MLSLFRKTWVWIWLHSFFFSPIFRSFFSSLNFSLYVNNLLLASLRRTSLRKQSYVIHIQWPRSFSVTPLGDLCCWKGKRGYWAILLRIYGTRRRNHGLHGVVISEGAEVRNHLADEIMCEERSRVLVWTRRGELKCRSNSDLLKRFLGIREAGEELTCSFLEA